MLQRFRFGETTSGKLLGDERLFNRLTASDKLGVLAGCSGAWTAIATTFSAPRSFTRRQRFATPRDSPPEAGFCS